MSRKHGTIRMRATSTAGVAKVEALITYKIVTGLVRDKLTSQFEVKKPQRFIKFIGVFVNGKQIFTGDLSIGVSDDPFFAMKVKGGKPGDMVKVRWEDNIGDWDELSRPIVAQTS